MEGERRAVTFQKLIDDGLLEIGDGYRAQNRELGGTGPIFLRAGHVTDTHIDFAGVDRFHEHVADRVRMKFSRIGDTIITTKGNSTGRTSFVSARMPVFVYSPHLSFWRSLDPAKLCSGFLRYWSRGAEFTEQLSGMKVSTDMAPYLSLTDQRRLTITLPTLPEQRAIASVLGALDDKIDLNRRMCQTLEEMARALFKSWFVDFDPVRARMEGRDPGLPKEIADLFPSRLVDSELGPIPEGWRVAALGEIMEINPARALRKAAVAPHLDMGNMPTHGHCAAVITERSFGSGARFIAGDTLVARITPCLENGKTAFVDFLPEGIVGWGSTEYIVIRPKPPTPVVVGYHMARTPRFREYAIQSMNGSSGRQRVPAEAVARFRMAFGPEAVAQVFGRIADVLMRRVRHASDESATLAALRDTLLPKLISGELRVPASLSRPNRSGAAESDGA